MKKTVFSLIFAVLVFAVLSIAASADEMTASGEGWELSPDGTLTVTEEETMLSAPWRKHRTEIRSVEIADGVTYIYNDAFSECTALESVEIPQSVTSVGVRAFEGCSALTDIILPEGLTVLGEKAFSRCSRLTEIVIPGTVLRIEENAFEFCDSLARLTVSEGVERIEVNAFYGCESLTEVHLPVSLTVIGQWAFTGCTNLKEINYSGTRAQWKSISLSPFYFIRSAEELDFNPVIRSTDRATHLLIWISLGVFLFAASLALAIYAQSLGSIGIHILSLALGIAFAVMLSVAFDLVPNMLSVFLTLLAGMVPVFIGTKIRKLLG